MPPFVYLSPHGLFDTICDLTPTTKVVKTGPDTLEDYLMIWHAAQLRYSLMVVCRRGSEWSTGVKRDVLIKDVVVVRGYPTGMERIKKRVSNHLATWSKIRHNNILSLYGLCWMGDLDGLPATVYPYCEGGTCTTYLRRNKDVDRISIICQVADGLKYLHSFSPPIKHGDIRADNILMKQDGTPLIADFGLSGVVGFSIGLAGTRERYRWMAPELFERFHEHAPVFATTASDVWAFGCLCLEILTGRLPWPLFSSAGNIISALARRLPPPLPPNIGSTPIGHIVRHCLIYEPLGRPRMAQLVDALSENDPDLLHTPTCPILPPIALSNLPPISLSRRIPPLSLSRVKDLTLRLDLNSFAEFPDKRGGFGNVWKGRLKHSLGSPAEEKGRLIAVKQLLMYRDMNEEDNMKRNKRMDRELKIWSLLYHPNILPLLGTCSFKEERGIVSEWQENGNATEWVRANPCVDRLKLVHRDLRGSNVVISKSGTPRLIDFGLASMTEVFVLSVTSETAGTTRWMAPELNTTGDEPVAASTKSDIFAFGMTMLELFTGLHPFPNIRNDAAVAIKYYNRERPSRPSSEREADDKKCVCAPMDDETWALVQKCWAQDPVTRPCANSLLQWFKEKLSTKSGEGSIP